MSSPIHRWARRPHHRSLRRPRNRRAFHPEWLEGRRLLSIFYVTSTSGSGAGSLPAAIAAVNSDPGGYPDAIEPGAAVLNQTIYLDSPLPALTRSNVTLQSLDVNGSGAGKNGGLVIKANQVDLFGVDLTAFNGTALTISGSRCDIQGSRFTGNHSDGIDVTGPLNQIGGPTPVGPTTAALGGNLISGNTGFGIFLDGTSASGNLIENNSIGTSQQGESADGNGLWGIEMYDAPDNVIGGIDQFSKGLSGNYGNIISGNAQGGLEIQGPYSTHETVQGNEIGTDLTGTVRIANAASGIYIGNWGAAGNGPWGITIGGTAAGARNVISGNGNFGIWMSGAVSGVLVQGNFIGTQASGTIAMANAANGIQLDSGAELNTIGGAVAGAGNYISGNGGSGVVLTGSGTAENLIAGNIIGANVSGESALPNALWGVLLADAGAGNTVGGAGFSEGLNLISGNDQGGVAIYGAGAFKDLVEGNRIGTDLTGTRALGNAYSGVYVGNWGTAGDAASFTTIADNLIAANGNSGIWITGGARNTLVVGNIIGTNVSETAGLGNADFGVLMDSGTSGNTIGGTSATAANVIAGNGTASTSQAFYGNVSIVDAGTSNNLVEGNDIGTNTTGATTLNPADSIGLGIAGGAANNTIGGTAPGAGNVISGNATYGVDIVGQGTSGNLIEGNDIGMSASGERAVTNGYEGVIVAGGASRNTIGSPSAAGRNIISANGTNTVAGGPSYPGVMLTGPGTSANLVEGNFIGLDAAGTTAFGNYGSGVAVEDGADGNTIGGVLAGDGNVIAANGSPLVAEPGTGFGSGININAFGTPVTGTLIAGNRIGTDASGTRPLGNLLDGVNIEGGCSGNIVGGAPFGGNLISANGGSGVQISGAGTNANLIEGNKVGTDVSGSSPLGNAVDGITIDSGASGNTIGGTAAGSLNVISANVHKAVMITDAGTDDNLVEGNFLGTDVNGTHALGNGGAGVAIASGAQFNTVGGMTAAARNVLAASTGNGVIIGGTGTNGATTSFNLVEGNFIGTTRYGTAALGEGIAGVNLEAGAQFNTIGGTTAGALNLISGNAFGVYIGGVGASDNLVEGNWIGTDASGYHALGNNSSGVSIVAGASGNTIGGTSAAARNVISGNIGNGVVLDGAGTSGNVVAGNFLGTTVDGYYALGNGDATDGADGIQVVDGASNNTIGGTTAGAGNAINYSIGNGVVIADTGTIGNLVAGNFIGIDASGIFAHGNSLDGIAIVNGASRNTVGGTTAAARNVISGNAGPGVAIDGSGTMGNVVEGDYIGTNGAGTSAIGNGNCGVWISGGAQDNTIGGTTAAARDVISGNVFHGVYLLGTGTTDNVVEGDDIGTTASGTGSLGNTDDGVMLAGVTGNEIANSLICFNAGYGIEGLSGSNAMNNGITGDTFFVTIGTTTYGNKLGATYFH